MILCILINYRERELCKEMGFLVIYLKNKLIFFTNRSLVNNINH